MHNRHKEAGLVSILTVILFMIFISVLVVGFIKIMSDEQRQATDNDLSASALAAAQSGVEDAKRVILLCLAGDPTYGDKNTGQCKNIFDSGRPSTSDPCDAFKNGSRGLFNSMNINYDTSTNEAIVGDPSFNQYYTCLSIAADSSTVVKPVTAEKSEIIPLNVTGNFDSIDLDWTGDNSTYGVRAPSTGSDFPARGAWTDVSGNPRPPVLRAQLIPYTPGAINLDASEQGSDTFFLVPAVGGATTTTVARSADSRGTPGNTRVGAVPVVYSACTLGVSITGYNCSMRITGLNSAVEKYYLRLSLLYGNSTSVTVTPFDTATGTSRDFNNVQYVIDVTGRTNDVYRRIQARVSPESTAAFPEYAIDTSNLICKDITVADAANTSYNCP